MNDRALRVLSRLYEEDARQREVGLPSAQRTRNLTRESGRFLQMLAIATGARRVLEIGSSNGVSTIWLAIAMKTTGGHVTGTELRVERAAEANRNLDEAGLAAFGRVHPGPAAATIAGLDGQVDLVFIDAEKEDYITHFTAAWPLVRLHGLVIADNVTSHDLARYQTMVRELSDAQTLTLPLDSGLEVTLKTG